LAVLGINYSGDLFMDGRVILKLPREDVNWNEEIQGRVE
jgi:hypothetical protein